MKELVAVVLGYLLGSFPFAYIAGRLAKGIDIREVGDHNAGAANVFREIGAKAGIAVLLADVAKGAIAVVVARAMGVSESLVLLTGLAAVAGHNWPISIGFRGGRGEATTLGVLLILLPRETAIALAIAAVPFLTTRNVMLTSCFIFIPLPLVGLWLGATAVLIGYSIALPCLVGFTHFLTTRHLPPEVRQQGAYLHRGR